MIETEATARRFGRSIGVVLPKHIVRRLGIRANEKVRLRIMSKETDWGGVFGTLKTRESVGELNRIADEGWEEE